MKTWKKIEETKKRSSEVNNLKKKNDMRMMSKIENMRNAQAALEDNQSKVQYARKNREGEKRKI